jgi:hypothetical protein
MTRLFRIAGFGVASKWHVMSVADSLEFRLQAVWRLASI